MRYPLLLAVVVASGCDSGAHVQPAPVRVGLQSPKRADRDGSLKRTDVVRKYGLFPSDEQRDLTGGGIALANKILGVDIPFRLRPSWQPAGESKFEEIDVYLVETDPPGKYGLTFVPRGGRDILVDARRVAAIRDLFSQFYSGAISLPGDQLLAISLLHEAGHIFNGDWGGMGEANDSPVPDLNVEENDGKRRELAADAFAARELREGMAIGVDASRFATSIKLATTQTMVITNQGFGRLADRFGSTTLGSPAEFRDDGRSHPNLAYRMLKMNYLINPSAKGKQLLDEFIRARTKPPGSPLFEMPTKEGSSARD